MKNLGGRGTPRGVERGTAANVCQFDERNQEDEGWHPILWPTGKNATLRRSSKLFNQRWLVEASHVIKMLTAPLRLTFDIQKDLDIATEVFMGGGQKERGGSVLGIEM
jgi:hypothetical protein